ncbi:GrpB family protein [Microvirga sp. BT350]|uniref:GrpB family protein n=1 Tax=Microvirga alba TaxID=2791025 RepID=A0A931BNE8_9HYPH|nr:GrpB family protein [Microvirga alba]
MPPPFKVELFPHDPRWSERAGAEGDALAAILGSTLLTVHHVGSTAIPGISAKPILDLLPVVTNLSELDRRKSAIEALGYEWWGEYGLPGRRYCTKVDLDTGRRLVQLHCYVDGSSEIERHLAFRDYLRERPEIARAYDEEKARCQSLHPDDSHAYSDCKDAWIKKIEAEAMARYRS